MIATKPLLITVKTILMTGAVLLVTGCTEADMKRTDQKWDMFWKTYSVPKGYHYNKRPEEDPYTGPQLYIPPSPATHTSLLPRRALMETAGTQPAMSAPPEIRPYMESELPPHASYTASYSGEAGYNTGAVRWEDATGDLATRLFAGIGIPAESIYLMAENANSPLSELFGAALRETLEGQGITVSASADTAGYALWYNATDMSGYGGNEVQLELFLLSGRNVAAEASDVYPLPAAGTNSYPTADIGYIDSTTHPPVQETQTRESNSDRPLSLLPY